MSFSALNTIIPIPERGFFLYTETHYYFDNTGYVPLSTSALTAARAQQNVGGFSFPGCTLVFRYFYIEKYKTIATIDAAYLALLDADLAAVRSAGMKIVLRFAYYNQSSSDSDAVPSLVQQHIAQLAPVLNRYASVVHAVEAGFIGAYGEWYYTLNFGDRGTVTAQNIADRNAVVSALLSNLDPSIFVLLRYLGSRQQFLGTVDPNPAGSSRLGHHNDAFLASYGNFGTYTNFTTQSEAANRTYLDQIANVPVGGESANYTPPQSDWPNASVELAAHHFTFLNPGYYQGTLSSWGQVNLDTVSRKIGHRLRLASASLPVAAAPGASIAFQFTVINDGWAAPSRNRPVTVVLVDGSGSRTSYPASVDVRAWGPASTTTFTFTGTAPNTAGSYAISLFLPDPAAELASRPEYAIRLASSQTWDAVTGFNNLGVSLAVAATSTATMGHLLLEDGTALLLEDGGLLLLENIPAPASSTPGRLLLESGDVLLLENGSALLLEQ